MSGGRRRRSDRPLERRGVSTTKSRGRKHRTPPHVFADLRSHMFDLIPSHKARHYWVRLCAKRQISTLRGQIVVFDALLTPCNGEPAAICSDNHRSKGARHRAPETRMKERFPSIRRVLE